jgi:hypothetical protein
MNSTAAGDSNVSSGLLVIGAAVEVNPIERWRYTEVWTVFALHAARKRRSGRLRPALLWQLRGLQ